MKPPTCLKDPKNSTSHHYQPKPIIQSKPNQPATLPKLHTNFGKALKQAVAPSRAVAHEVGLGGEMFGEVWSFWFYGVLRLLTWYYYMFVEGGPN